MPSYKMRPVVYEKIDPNNHPDFEIKETRVSDYLRRYGTGHIDDLPTTSSPEIHDERSVDEMLDSEFEPDMATETVDILMKIEENKQRFENALADLELTKTQRKKFDDALSAIKDPNVPTDRKREAYSVLDELIELGKVTRARN